jgi:hypothetical protein
LRPVSWSANISLRIAANKSLGGYDNSLDPRENFGFVLLRSFYNDNGFSHCGSEYCLARLFAVLAFAAFAALAAAIPGFTWTLPVGYGCNIGVPSPVTGETGGYPK